MSQDFMACYKTDISSAKFMDISRHISPSFAPSCLVVFAREL